MLWVNQCELRLCDVWGTDNSEKWARGSEAELDRAREGETWGTEEGREVGEDAMKSDRHPSWDPEKLSEAQAHSPNALSAQQWLGPCCMSAASCDLCGTMQGLWALHSAL